jgi:4-hydroxy-2-oxoheptanedioate aldolase
MELTPNAFKAAIRSGKQQIGLWVALASPYSAEICAGSGFDWLLFDGEHGPNDPPSMLPQLQAAAAYPVSAIVRPAWNDKVLLKRYLDVGFQSFLVPYVQTAAEAEAAVAAIRYPIRGVRGVAGSTRASRYGRIADYARRAEAELCMLVQIESREGLDNLDAIARTDGIDGVFIGPADLAAGLGRLGDIGHAEVQSAIKEAIARIKAAGKPAGILATDDASTKRYIEWGTTFTAVGVDVMMLARETEKLAKLYKK